jgi:hypothetical protein
MMKKSTLVIALAALTLSVPAAFAAMDHDHDAMPMDHGSMPMDHGSMKMDHGSMKMDHGDMGKPAHEEVVDGVKATFTVIDIQKKMKAMGMSETHHIMVMFTDAKSGRKLGEGNVNLKVMGPDKSEQMKELMGMGGGFGADFSMPKKGKYGVMAKFKLADGKVRSVKFWYTVK